MLERTVNPILKVQLLCLHRAEHLCDINTFCHCPQSTREPQMKVYSHKTYWWPWMIFIFLLKFSFLFWGGGVGGACPCNRLPLLLAHKHHCSLNQGVNKEEEADALFCVCELYTLCSGWIDYTSLFLLQSCCYAIQNSL